jgi:glyoxylate reductase
MERPRIVLAASLPAAAIERIAAHAPVVDVSAEPRAHWGAALADARAVVVNSAVPVDATLLAMAPQLQLVSTVSVGYDNVDVGALRARGIQLANTRGTLDEAVADLSYVLAVMALRRLGRALNWVQDGRWERAEPPYGRDVEGAVLGIVGFGGIGPKLARRAQTAGMHVIYTNRRPRDDDERTGALYRPFEALLAEADCIVILVPLSAETRGLFGDAAFAAMKPDAVLVNAARGPIVDTAALVRALDEGRIAGAALDVTDPEPLPLGHPLLGRDDVIVTPHVGSATVETRARMAMRAADNVTAFLRGEPLLSPVVLDGA